MSFEVTKMVLDHSKSKKFARLVLLELAGAVNEEERRREGTAKCWPAVETLCNRTGLSYRCVRDQLNILRYQLGEITWEKRGYRQSNMYTICVPFDDDGGPTTTEA